MEVIEIAKKIEKNGGKLFLVGGAVRDKLLGKAPVDYDYCVCGISQDEFIKLFPEAKIQGKAFPVFVINGDEYALARKEYKIARGHKGFEMHTDKSITIQDDLKRRDITVNSIAMDVLTNEIIDPFNGEKDLKNKMIRATSVAFLEDPLRMYRVARFAAQLSENSTDKIFKVEKSTLELMKQCKVELLSLSSERVFAEFEKALKTNHPSVFFNVLKEAEVLDVHFKEIYNLIGVEQPLKYHPEGDAYNHTMQVVDKLAQFTDDASIVFAGLVHDLGKALTPQNEWPHHIGHEENGIEPLRNFCKAIKVPTKWYKIGIIACKEHMKAGIYNKMTIKKKVDFLARNSKTLLGLKGLEMLANADNTSDEVIMFAKVGEEMIKNIDAKEYPENMDFNILKEKVRLERIAWLRNVEKSYKQDGGNL